MITKSSVGAAQTKPGKRGAIKGAIIIVGSYPPKKGG